MYDRNVFRARAFFRAFFVPDAPTIFADRRDAKSSVARENIETNSDIRKSEGESAAAKLALAVN